MYERKRYVRKLILLILVIVFLEIGTFILVGKEIGVFPVFILILATAFLGMGLVRRHVQVTVVQIRLEMMQGKIPRTQLMDGLSILIGGILLIIPGFITDLIGLLFILPQTRSFFKDRMYQFIKKKMDGQTITFRR